LEQVGANYNSIVSGQSALNTEQINQLFNMYVQSSIQVAQKTYKNWSKLCCNVEQALVDIIYDLNNGISAFTGFNSYINNEQWEEAASDLLGTKFCSQVKSRCTDDAALIKQGCNGKKNNEEQHPAAKQAQ